MTPLRSAVQQYLAMRRSLGFHLSDTGRLLLKFVTFMEQHRAAVVTTPLALAWAQQSQTVQPAERARRLSIVRIFARYRHAIDPRTEIPPDGLLPYRPKRARPYRYSDDEIRRLLRAARRLPARGGFRPWAYHGLFGLLSVSGLRLGEARNLRLDDVDLDAAVLTLHHTKFGKSRLVPLHASTCKVLAPIWRDAGAIGPDGPSRPMCSCPTGATGSMSAASTAPSTRSPDRSDCVGPRTTTDRGFMTYGIGSPRRRCGGGTAPARIPSGACRSCQRTSGMCTSAIPIGISAPGPS